MNVKTSYDEDNIFNDYLEARKDDTSPHNMEVKQNIINLVGDVTDKSILDIGCGVGDFSYYFANKGAKKVVGIDISTRVIDYANKHNKHKVTEYKVMNADQINELNEKFDIVISDIVINYIEDYESLMKNIYNLLNKNGIVVFSQVHPFSTSPLGGRKWTIDNDNFFYHLSNYGNSGMRKTEYFGGELVMYHRTFSELLNTAIKNGFEVVEIIEPVPSSFELEIHPDRIKNMHKPSFLIIKMLSR